MESELEEALSRVQSQLSTGIQNALQNLEVKSPEEQRLVLPTQSGTLYFPLKEISHIESERNYSFIHLSAGRKELSSKNPAYFDEILEDKGFMRCHWSFLVNRDSISALKAEVFVLKSVLQIPISRRKKGEVMEWYNGG